MPCWVVNGSLEEGLQLRGIAISDGIESAIGECHGNLLRHVILVDIVFQPLCLTVELTILLIDKDCKVRNGGRTLSVQEHCIIYARPRDCNTVVCVTVFENHICTV